MKLNIYVYVQELFFNIESHLSCVWYLSFRPIIRVAMGNQVNAFIHV